jgi:hypothetical protein
MLHDISSHPEWKIQIYRVQSHRRLQRMLAAFQRIDRPGVVALGTQSGPDWFVIIECGSLSAEIHARRVVMTIDPRAVRTYDCELRSEDVWRVGADANVPTRQTLPWSGSGDAADGSQHRWSAGQLNND